MLDEKTPDIKENYIKDLDEELLAILLKDRSSNRNIIWATDMYASRGSSYGFHQPITVKTVTGRFGNVIRPRIDKSKKEQQHRIKDKAEVFTPSWICNKQNNLVDNAWFGRENVFNIETEKTWQTNYDKIVFPEGKTWQDYVKENRLEITCGEAPYLASRYDTVTGNAIPIKDRIGLLDRKLRIVSENVENEQEWVSWAETAFKAIYGYEWQGDNVLLARENLLFTFSDYYEDKFGVFAKKEYLIEIAKILSWNIWQMDGLKFVIPDSCKPVEEAQMSFLEEPKMEDCIGCIKNDVYKHSGIYCYVMNWQTGKKEKFVNQLRKNHDR